MPAWLTAIDGELSGRRVPLKAPCLVGRGPYNHIVLDDVRISRQHAKISPEAGGHVVQDLNSANGTYVNDVLVERQRLQQGDVVRFGPFSFRFDRESSEVSRTSHFVEEQTLVGDEPPTSIIDSLAASTSTPPPAGSGLVELEDADRKLRILYGFTQSIATTLDIGELTERILRNLLDVFPRAQMAAVYLRESTTGAMEPRKVLRRDGYPQLVPTLGVMFHEDVVERARAILSAPMTIDGRPGAGVQMHAPMISVDGIGGVLHVRGGELDGAMFVQQDLDLLDGLAAQAAMALQNARMHQRSLKQQRLQQDLVLAEQIQKSFLPQQLPSVPGLDFLTEYRPAHSVGGDFYDLFWLNPERIGIFIGDVAGKGVSAALLMARISSDLRVATLAEAEPGRALARVNGALLEREQHDIFVTGIYLTLDVATRKLVLANAGHPSPYIRHPDGLERVDGGAGSALGLFEDVVYPQIELELSPGDSLVLCTDGVLEASDELGEHFGLERLERSLAGGTSRGSDLADRLLRDVREHVGDAEQSDDLTLIICGVEPRRRRDEPTQKSKILI